MKRMLLVLTLFCFAGPLISQSIQGFYAGELKLTGRNVRMNVQLDLVQDSSFYKGVLRSRFVENRVVTGCECWVQGEMINGEYVLRNKFTLRETEVPQGTCGQMLGLIKFKAKEVPGAEPELAGTWFDKYGDNFGKFTLTRIDTAISYTVAEDEEKAVRGMLEMQIAIQPQDSTRLKLMRAYRPSEVVDSINLPVSELVMILQAPEADPYHKLSVILGNNIVLQNKAIRTQGAKITLQENQPGEVELVLIAHHAMVEAMFPVNLTLQWDGQEKKWTIPVSTMHNRVILLRFNAAE